MFQVYLMSPERLGPHLMVMRLQGTYDLYPEGYANLALWTLVLALQTEIKRFCNLFFIYIDVEMLI